MSGKTPRLMAKAQVRFNWFCSLSLRRAPAELARDLAKSRSTGQVSDQKEDEYASRNQTSEDWQAQNVRCCWVQLRTDD